MKARVVLRPAVLAAAILLGAGAVRAQTAASPSVQPAPGPSAGTVTGRQPLPPASQAVPRGQRTFARCNREALARRLRGADRRHFVTRCRLGYGYRLFRRRQGPT